MSGWFRRFRPSPPSAGLVPCPSTLRFSFPLPFQGLPAPGQVCRVGVLSFFFCVPLFASWFSIFFISSSRSPQLHFPLIFIFTPFSVALPCQKQGVCVCVCVTHLYRCKTSITFCIYIYIYICGGSPGSLGGR